MINTAIILAGGLGTRLREVISDQPKAMVPINNRPFLEYQLDYWIDQGISKFILSVGYLKEFIVSHFGSMYKGASIEYVIESSPLGTGGGLLFAASKLNEPFLVLNGDTFIEVDLKSFYNFHVKSSSLWTIALFRTNDFKRFLRIEINNSGEILSLKSRKNTSRLANGGVYLIDPATFLKLSYYSGDSVSLENQLLPNFINNGGKLFGQECMGKFIDIGLPDDYYRAKDVLPK